MPEIPTIGDKIAGSAQQVMEKGLGAVEGGVDNAIGSMKDAVHELRNEVEDIVDRAFSRFKEVWQDQQPKVAKYIAAHPWLVLRGFVLVSYLIAGRQQNRAPYRM
jgi:hypothetical protein